MLCVWHWRNINIFDSDFLRPWEPGEVVYKYVKEVREEMEEQMKGKNAINMVVRWEKLEEGLINLWRGRIGMAGCGDVFRDHVGRWRGFC